MCVSVVCFEERSGVVVMNRPWVFLRDDDVWTDDAVFLELASFYAQHNIPVVYGVIPNRLEPRMIKVLRDTKKINPGLVDIVQHGFRHINYAQTGSLKYEFGEGRTLAQQQDDIRSGMAIMHGVFGKYFTPAFIPPYHGYAQGTLKIVQQLGFSVFSAGKKTAFPGKTVLDLPARVSLNKFQPDGAAQVLRVEEMLARFQQELGGGGMIGVVFHHRFIKTSSDMRAMKVFSKFLARMRDDGEVRLVIFSDLIRLYMKKAVLA